MRRFDQVCESVQRSAPIAVHCMLAWLSRAPITSDFGFARCRKDLRKLDACTTAPLSRPEARHTRKAKVSLWDGRSWVPFALISRRFCAAWAVRFVQPVKECNGPHPPAEGDLAAQSCAS